jgi:sulfite reductase beta subunit-like hemoprotein
MTPTSTPNAPAVRKKLSPVEEQEIKFFEENIAALEAGALDSDDFRRFRLEHGIYGIRNTTDEHMMRVKLKWGDLSADQLDALADIAENYATPKAAHVTTRQAIQMHHLRRRDVPAIIRRVSECGLTTREACGNTVRNVTACHYAGTSVEEVFDVRPYAQTVADYFLRNPIGQNLPRKFKIGFEGCPTDHCRIPIHDFGAVAKVRTVNGKEERGFQCYVGGGLGATPHTAQLIEEFTPEDLLIPTIEACIRIFDRHGNRKDKARARIKFVVKDWGIEKMRETIMEERKIALLTRSGRVPNFKIDRAMFDQAPPQVDLPAQIQEPTDAAYKRWRLTNVLKQKQPGYMTVLVRCYLGDIYVQQMHDLANIARRYCGGRLRSAITQNLVLQWVPEKAIPLVYAELLKAGLAEANAERVADITRCPGADTCQIAITRSRGLAQALTPIFSDGLGEAEELQDIKIKISGCFNSCGQHHIADLGFYGSSKVVNGKEVPHYVMLLGGYTQEGLAKFGKPTLQIPAQRVPEAARKLLQFYREQRQPNETWRPFIERTGTPKIKELLQEFTTVPENNPKMYEDLGAEGVSFKMEMGKGECAA